MRFRLERHNQILTILECLNSELLKNCSAYFGGGTILTLDFQEYRSSVDIDFIASVNNGGYRYLRTVIFDNGCEGLFNDLSKIKLGRNTTDQYGIQMVVYVEDIPIKTEIIAENRFQLDSPRYPNWSPVPCLSLNDCFTSKLLSNSDRYIDKSVKSRDLIDLAVLRLQSPIPQSAIDKAENAYEVIRPLKKAIALFQQKPEDRQSCFEELQISESWICKIIDDIDLLCLDFGLPKIDRIFKEKHDL
ncbi:nucleotidyl transferase AbiEii/AbiGii toxin family protein [Calothrix sp. UHCC 0171]|uniref:nucleotidyl transferase AbiEii/AbiGii toxin family protein n=1 Tax=Calothrix sp. UHCC 0171 TaxID=3110245 RepID=UPI002B214E2B|nr:nucleotidyl transferase AbiEii/AbiGii toxin family protein [Calothrix sp. UHCC 0171]MEA5569615.1 nucleotidyl transferase AbiEii/AbiGii toxin family protein [Calothrix sp. UHCC 0171]